MRADTVTVKAHTRAAPKKTAKQTPIKTAFGPLHSQLQSLVGQQALDTQTATQRQPSPSPTPESRHSGQTGKVALARRELLFRSQMQGPPAPKGKDTLYSPLRKGALEGAKSDIQTLFTPGAHPKTVESLRNKGLISGVSQKQTRARVDAERAGLVKNLVGRQRATESQGLADPELHHKLMSTPLPQLRKLAATPVTKQEIKAESLTPNLAGIVSGLSYGTAALGGLASKVVGGGIPGRALGDLVALPGQAIPAAYLAATDPGKLAKGLASGVLGHVAAGDFKGAGKAFSQHPLFSLMELHGAESVAGRGAGAALRGAGKRESSLAVRRAMASAGDTRRAPLALSPLENTRAYQVRHYSKDVIRKGAQVALDKRLEKGPMAKTSMQGRVQTQLPRQPHPLMAKIPGNRTRAERVDRAEKAYGDFRSTRATDAGRVARTDAGHFVHNAMPTTAKTAVGRAIERRLPAGPTDPKGLSRLVPKALKPKAVFRPEHQLIGMYMEKTIRTRATMMADIARERKKIETYYQKHADDASFTPTQREKNRARAAAIDSVLNDPKALKRLGSIVESGRTLAGKAYEQARAGVESGSMARSAAERAPLFPAAQSFAEAKYGAGVREHLQARHAEAKAHLSETKADHDADVQSAEGALRTARVELGNARGRASVLSRNVGVGGRGGAHGISLATAKVARAEEAVSAAKKTRKDEVKVARKLAEKLGKKAANAKDQLHGPNGEKLSNEEIIAKVNEDLPEVDHLTAADFAHIPHNERLLGKSAYWRGFKFQRANYTGSKKRTGSLYEKGASPFSIEHIRDAIVGREVLQAHIDEHDQMLKEIGVRHPSGRYFKNIAEAENFLELHKDDPRYAGMVPARAFSSVASKEEVAKIWARQEGNVAEDPTGTLAAHFAARLMADPKGKPGPDSNNVVLAPDAIIKRLTDHAEHGSGSPLQHMAAHLFRRSVLPFSVKWVFGNQTEAALRSAMNGVTPLDVHFGAKVFKSFKASDQGGLPALAAEMGSGQLNHPGATVRVTSADLAVDHPRLAAFGEALGKLPIFHETKAVVRTAIQASFKINRTLEQQFGKAVVGKLARRQMQEMTGSWTKALRMQPAVMDQFTKGMVNTPEQIDFLKQFHHVLGQYSNFSPTMRKRIQGVAPFLPWYLNSARFIAITLPFEHPMKAAVLASAEATFQQDIQDQHKVLGDLNRGSLGGAIPLGNGKYIDLEKLSPFGFSGPIARGDPTNVVSPFYPAAQGVVQAARGLDPFGRPLRTIDKATGKSRKLTPLEQVGSIFNTGLESVTPGLSLLRRAREGGGTATATSNALLPQTKPGSSHGPAWKKILNPVNPIDLSGAGSKASNPLKDKYGPTTGGTDLKKKYGLGQGSVDLKKKYGG